MEKIIEEVKQSAYLENLPPVLSGFELNKIFAVDGQQVIIFTYDNKEQKRSFSILYDSTTKEYIGRVTAGLVEFSDIGYIVPDRSTLEKVLAEHLSATLDKLGRFAPENLESIFKEKKILEWPYAAQLPQEIAGFSLYIKPPQPLKIINGSYIILDYSDFLSESNLIIYYNIYRDEFFGEVRIRRTPRMAAVFETKTLAELEEQLALHLAPTLLDIRAQLDRT